MEIMKWIHSKEAKMLSHDAKEKAWEDFKIKYPFADTRKFVAEADFIDKTHAPADINIISKRVQVFGKVYHLQTQNIGLMK